MYAALWRILPGPWWLRVIILLVALAVILYLCFWYVFPWISTLIDPDDVSVGGR